MPSHSGLMKGSASLGMIASLVTFFGLELTYADSLWTSDKNPFTAGQNYNTGDVLLVAIQEEMSATLDYKTDRNESVQLTLQPDQNVAGFLPKADHTKNIKSKNEDDNKASGNFQAVLAVRVTAIESGGLLRVLGQKTIQYGKSLQSIRLEGVIHPSFVRAGRIPSTHIAELTLIFNGPGIQKLDGNITLDPNSQDNLSDAQKQEILRKYLQRFFGEAGD